MLHRLVVMSSQRGEGCVAGSLRSLSEQQYQCVFPYSLIFFSGSSILKHSADRDCLDSGGYNLADQ
jgi:hypothetical protein